MLESGTKQVAASLLGADAVNAAVLNFTGAAPVAGTSYVAYATKEGVPSLFALRHHPFGAELYVSGSTTPAIVVNARGLSYFEHRRSKDSAIAAPAPTDAAAAAAAEPDASGRRILHWGEDGKPVYEDGAEGEGAHGDAHHHGDKDAAAAAAAAAPAHGEADLWEESFQTHHDSKPHGPTSVGVDIGFPGSTHAYGIPEHASSHALKATDGTEGSAEYAQPYRLYNLDVFEYELDNPMALYGSIPFMLAHGPAAGGRTAGVFWNNPTETYIDVAKPGPGKGGVTTRWISESGVWDLSLVPGPSGKAVITQYTSLTGTQALPPLFALGYHQCRWNYRDEADVFAVDAKFEELSFPYDVLWLDIEHTDGKRYFTWDSALFPRPAEMQAKLAARGHRMVTIIDPHIKKDSGYRIHKEAVERGLYVKAKDGGEYDGWCWPGSSGYLDFTSPAVRSWWADQFRLDKYPGSSLSLFTWNDMNEPSVFNGPEVSMHKDAQSLAGVEHREWHNLYGFYQQMASAEGQTRRSPDSNARPFVLSRAFFAGSQRYGAIWTGDNDATWEHLAQAAPMLLTIGAAGLTFSGADVGGFFHNPSTELMTRWYQAGSWQPFFRAHAHIDTARREPWLFGDEVMGRLRDIVRTRYSYLPLWYTLFAAAAETGVPTMRAMWLEFPGDAAVLGIDDQWMVGDAILVKPIIAAGATSTSVVLPGPGPWYDVQTGAKATGSGSVTVAAPLDKIPAFQRGGSIVPRQMRPRRSSAVMQHDPYTLIVALDSAASAAGDLYMDDGTSYDYSRKGLFRLRRFAYAPASATTHVLRSTLAGGNKAFVPTNTVERVVVLGLGKAPKSVTATEGEGASDAGRALSFEYDAAADVLTVRKPDVKAAYDFTITLGF